MIKEVDDAATLYLGLYDKAVRKRKCVQEKDEFSLQLNPKWCKTNSDVFKSKSKCSDYVEKCNGKDDSEPCSRSSLSWKATRKKMAITRSKKKTMFPYPANNDVYTPTEMCQYLMDHVDEEDY
eukprot:2869324-Ditylum_brightwellii.AAC.1